MRTWNWHFSLCLTGTILLAAGVIFLPRHISRSLDQKELNWVETSERNDLSFLEPSSNSILENDRAFRFLTRNGENLTLISSIQEPGRMNSELLERVYEQVMIASELGVFPWIEIGNYEWGMYMEKNSGTESPTNSYQYWTDQAQFAKYYSMTYESEESPNKTEMISFWYLRFSDNETFDYYFIVNALSYQIYYAEIYNSYTDLYAETSESMDSGQSTNASVFDANIVVDASAQDMFLYDDPFAVGCMQYYEADGYSWVGPETLYNKLMLVILYYAEQPVYISQSVVQNCAVLSDDYGTYTYRGIGVGFQELANKVRFLAE